MIYRIHFSVKDKTSGEEGVLSYYLPVDEGLTAAKKAGKDPSRYQLLFLANESSPTYHLCNEGSPEKGGKFKTLKGLESALDELTRAGERIRFSMGFG